MGNWLHYYVERCISLSRWCRWFQWRLQREPLKHQREWLALRKLPIELSGLRKRLCRHGGGEYCWVSIKAMPPRVCSVLYRWDIRSSKGKIPKLLLASRRQAWKATCEVLHPVRPSRWGPNLRNVTWLDVRFNTRAMKAKLTWFWTIWSLRSCWGVKV